MHPIRSLVRFLVLGFWVAVAAGAVMAPEKVPTERDRQVLDALLLRLAVDPKFDVSRVSTNPPTIVLHREATSLPISLNPEGGLPYLGERTVALDATRNFEQRNQYHDPKAGGSNSLNASFLGLTFSPGIIVTNVADFKGRYILKWHAAYPRARGWVETCLPGYSNDGTKAFVEARCGPWPHYSWLYALLEQRNGIWEVKWFEMVHYL